MAQFKVRIRRVIVEEFMVDGPEIAKHLRSSINYCGVGEWAADQSNPVAVCDVSTIAKIEPA
jgi:hypothetical protein